MLAGLLIAIVGLGCALVGTSFTISASSNEVYDGRVVNQEVVTANVPTGNRAERRDVEVVQLLVEYEADGARETMKVQRAKEIADSIPVGTAVLVYGKGEEASLNPNDDLLGPVLTFGGIFLFFFGSLGMYLGWVASRRLKAQ